MPSLRLRAVPAAIKLVAIAATLIPGLPAAADPIDFAGTLTRSGGGALPGGRCALPALTVFNNNVGGNIATGSSNLGDFLMDVTACIVPPPPGVTYDGLWDFDFSGGNTLYGTTGSVLTATATPGLFDLEAAFVVTGGKGKFLGATGAFSEIGFVDRRDLSRPVAIGDFRGELNLRAIPEPATYALILAGIAAIGVAAKGRRASTKGGAA